jgi:N utilization substance protein B
MPVRKKPPLARRRKARQLILQAVYQWLLTDSELTDISKQFHEQNQGKIDWEFFDEVLPGVLKSVEALDKHLHPLLDRKLEALDPIEKALHYLGTYELANRIDVPYRVVINECVELAKMFGATESHKYINGVLDKLAPELRAAEYGRRP